MQKIIGYFNVIWDDAAEVENLAWSSDPRVVIDTGGMSPRATAFANLLSQQVARLTDDDLAALTRLIEERLASREA